MKKLLLAFALLLMAVPSFGATYYISEGGSGSGCTNAADPCDDADYSSGAAPFDDLSDDTVYIIGTITSIVTGQAGTSGHQHILRGDADGYAAGVIDGADTRSQCLLLADYLTVMNLELTSSTQENIGPDNATKTGVILDGVTSHDSVRMGADVQLASSQIYNSVFRDNGENGLFTDTTTDLTIHDCQAYDNGAEGANNFDGFTLTVSSGLIAYNLTAYGNLGTSSSGLDVAHSTGVLYNSISYNNGGAGLNSCCAGTMKIYNVITYDNDGNEALIYDADQGGTTNIYNSTFVKSTDHVYSIVRIGLSGDSGTLRTVDFSNNVFVGGYVGIWIDETKANLTSDYNLFYDGSNGVGRYSSTDMNIASWRTALGGCPDTGNDCSSVNSAPQFVNAAASDFRVLPGSPAENAGVAVAGVTYDAANNTRSDPPEIGAYEIFVTYKGVSF